jgi:uncharacterized MAPEG superfamily protein
MPSVLFYTIMWPLVICLGGLASMKLLPFVDDVDSVHRRLAAVEDGEDGWTFLALTIVTHAVTIVSLFSVHTRLAVGMTPPDQFVFATVEDDEHKGKGRPVRMVQEGAAGAFNRAQRAFLNTQETLAVVLTHIVLAGRVAPRLTVTLATIIGVGRILFAAGYTRSFALRSPGFMIANLLGQSVLAGFVLLVALATTVAPGLRSFLP